MSGDSPAALITVAERVTHLDSFRNLLAGCSTDREVMELLNRKAPGTGLLTRRRRSVLNAVDAKLTALDPRRKPKEYTPYEE